MVSNLTKRSEYVKFLNELKERIRTAQTKAVLSVNRELISLYWDIGKSIVEKQNEMGWGKGVVEQLARDLRREFPDVKGFSSRNLWDMRRFYLSYKDYPNLRQAVAEIPWGHNLAIINKIKDVKQRGSPHFLSRTIEHPRYLIETMVYGEHFTTPCQRWQNSFFNKVLGDPN